jgi:hypothetical protein
MSTENQAFEYALGLFAVLIGLAITDIAASFHRLLRIKSRVIWDPLTLLAAFYALCMAVYMWFDIWGVRHFHLTRHFFFYIGLILQLFLLYLIAAASLPDESAGDRVDLREYYAGNRQHFWQLMAIFHTVYFAFGLYFSTGEPDLPKFIFVLMWCLASAPIVVALVLLRVQSRALHYLGLAVLYIVMALHYGMMEIN